MKDNYFRLILITLIILMGVSVALMEFIGYEKFYTGEHNIDLGYNTKNTTFRYDIMSTGEIVETTYLYRLGGNQIREAIRIFVIVKFLYLIMGILIGMIIILELINNKGKDGKRLLR